MQQLSDDMPPVLRLREMADFSGVTWYSLTRALEKGKIEGAYRDNNSWRIPREVAIALRANHKLMKRLWG